MASAYDNRLSIDPVEEAFHPVDLENTRWSRRRPSFARRALRGLGRFAIAVGIGVGGTLAWQSYGDIARERIANASPQLAWLAPQTPPIVPVAQIAATTVAAAPAIPSPDSDQLEAMNQSLLAVRQRVDQLAAIQQQMAGDIAGLRASEQDILQRISAPPPRPPAPPARKPVPPVPLTPEQGPPVR